MRIICLLPLIFIAAVSQVHAQGPAPQMWTGLDHSFAKENYANWSNAVNQDRISANVHITRGNNQGLFNIASESSYQGWDNSPEDTEWAFSGLNGCAEFAAGEGAVQYESLTFDHLARSLNVNIGDYIEGTPGVLHLISENIYIDIIFTSWTSGGAGGGFAYNRANGTADGDNDGLDEIAEYANNTDPWDPDTDFDGYWDGTEVDADSLPLDPNEYPGLQWTGSVHVGDSWRWLDWFGWFNVRHYPWIYHLQHGWLYPFGDTVDSVVFWDNALQEFWQTSDSQYPYIYRFSDDELYWYLIDSKPRWCVKLSNGQWEQW